MWEWLVRLRSNRACSKLTSSCRLFRSALLKPEYMNVCPHRGSFVLTNVFVRRLDLSEGQGSKSIWKWKKNLLDFWIELAMLNLLWRMGFERLRWVGKSSRQRKRLSISVADYSIRSPTWSASDHRHWDRSSSTARSDPGSGRSDVSNEPAFEASADN